MAAIPVIALFDVGKTNKKWLLFNEDYQVVAEQSVQLTEIRDEDGDACEDIESLTAWLKDSLVAMLSRPDIQVKAVNMSTYGASLVHLDADLRILTPLYNYLKPYPAALLNQFFEKYGPEADLCLQTASPLLGSLNSGLQAYRLKHERPVLFKKIAHTLHLPQYLTSLFHQRLVSDITSLGCHTMCWQFDEHRYHPWLREEGIEPKLAELFACDQTWPATMNNHAFVCGGGLHDSSAALIPYLMNFTEPFLLLSTGTWNISLNPFNQQPLTAAELKQDCLCYLQFQGKPVKASRLFAGQDHENQVARLAAHFQVKKDFYQSLHFDPAIAARPQLVTDQSAGGDLLLPASNFSLRDLADFPDYSSAYHQLVRDIMVRQLQSMQLVMHNAPVNRVFVDGGFSQNPIFMHLLAQALNHTEVYAAKLSQASALGAALAIHRSWNAKPLASDLIELKFYGGRGSNGQ